MAKVKKAVKRAVAAKGSAKRVVKKTTKTSERKFAVKDGSKSSGKAAAGKSAAGKESSKGAAAAAAPKAAASSAPKVTAKAAAAPAVKAAAAAPAKKAVVGKKGAPGTPAVGMPLIDTNLAAQNAASMLLNRSTLEHAEAAAESAEPAKESAAFKNLKDQLAKPKPTGLAGLFGPSGGAKKDGGHFNVQQQKGHNQTFGGMNKTGVPRRTNG
jgi:hypothetical protein